MTHQQVNLDLLDLQLYLDAQVAAETKRLNSLIEKTDKSRRDLGYLNHLREKARQQ